MRTNFDLPPANRRELALVVRILFEEFEAILVRATQQWKKGGRNPGALRQVDFGILVTGWDRRISHTHMPVRPIRAPDEAIRSSVAAS
jgi:hypothetical protein